MFLLLSIEKLHDNEDVFSKSSQRVSAVDFHVDWSTTLNNPETKRTLSPKSEWGNDSWSGLVQSN